MFLENLRRKLTCDSLGLPLQTNDRLNIVGPEAASQIWLLIFT